MSIGAVQLTETVEELLSRAAVICDERGGDKECIEHAEYSTYDWKRLGNEYQEASSLVWDLAEKADDAILAMERAIEALKLDDEQERKDAIDLLGQSIDALKTARKGIAS